MDTKGLEQMLGQLRATSSLAAGKATDGGPANAPGGIDFAQALKSAIDQVNQAQQQA